MTILLAVASFLLLISGVVKVKAAERVALGLPVLAVLELLVGIGIFSQIFIRDFTPGQGMGILVGSVALLLVSSVQVGMAVRRRQRLRTASEGSRLANYVKYLSREDSPSD